MRVLGFPQRLTPPPPPALGGDREPAWGVRPTRLPVTQEPRAGGARTAEVGEAGRAGAGEKFPERPGLSCPGESRETRTHSHRTRRRGTYRKHASHVRKREKGGGRCAFHCVRKTKEGLDRTLPGWGLLRTKCSQAARWPGWSWERAWGSSPRRGGTPSEPPELFLTL